MNINKWINNEMYALYELKRMNQAIQSKSFFLIMVDQTLEYAPSLLSIKIS
jgi:hypothetical protein